MRTDTASMKAETIILIENKQLHAFSGMLLCAKKERNYTRNVEMIDARASNS